MSGREYCDDCAGQMGSDEVRVASIDKVCFFGGREALDRSDRVECAWGREYVVFVDLTLV
jgi:hypothetical protein